MDRRSFLRTAGSLAGTTVAAVLVGCRGHQYGHVLEPGKPDLVGSHAAGAEVFNPLIDESVAKLLARQCEPVMQEASFQGAEVIGTPKTVCFIGVENKSIEELGDFKDQIYQQIDTVLVQSQAFQPLNKRVLDAGSARNANETGFTVDPGQYAAVHRGAAASGRSQSTFCCTPR